MMPSDRALADLAARLGEALVARRERLATAESCTGGWIGKVATDVAGSSRWFAGGLVTYANTAKRDLLDVSDALLETHGAVSEAVAGAMAEGARRRFAVDLGVAVSGIAGPDGGTAEKPVGTVCFGYATLAGTQTERRHFPGDRETVRRLTVAHALTGVLARLDAFGGDG
jgi:nicotinamide-nucleotide amidase